MVLVQGDVWLTIDAETGVVLHQEDPPCPGTECDVAVLGDSANHRIVVKPGLAMFVTYQLQNDGTWMKVVAAEWDYINYAPVSRSDVVVIQGAVGGMPDKLYGLDMLTGQQVWNVSDYALLTGSWVNAYQKLYLLPLRHDTAPSATRLGADQLHRLRRLVQSPLRVRPAGLGDGQAVGDLSATRTRRQLLTL